MKCLNRKEEMTGCFCTICGTKLLKSSFKCVMTEYFRKGFTYIEILDFLLMQHSVQISLTTLKKKLKSFDLKRRFYSRMICLVLLMMLRKNLVDMEILLGIEQCGTI